MISARALSFAYGRAAVVSNLHFDIAAGEIVGLIGANGAGKTTTLRLLAGYLMPTGGTVLIDGQPLSAADGSWRKRLGYAPEGSQLYGDLTVAEHLRLVCAVTGTPHSACINTLENLALTDVAPVPVAQLSKGYRSRVSLAMALVHAPSLLILDEPGDGLDPLQSRALAALLSEKAATAAILFSTHNLEQAARLCTRLLLMVGGVIRFDGSPDALRAQAGTTHLDDGFAALAGAQP